MTPWMAAGFAIVLASTSAAGSLTHINGYGGEDWEPLAARITFGIGDVAERLPDERSGLSFMRVPTTLLRVPDSGSGVPRTVLVRSFLICSETVPAERLTSIDRGSCSHSSGIFRRERRSASGSSPSKVSASSASRWARERGLMLPTTRQWQATAAYLARGDADSISAATANWSSVRGFEFARSTQGEEGAFYLMNAQPVPNVFWPWRPLQLVGNECDTKASFRVVLQESWLGSINQAEPSGSLSTVDGEFD